MNNSRARFQRTSEEKPTNTSKGRGLILETPYRPGFVEDKDLESVKMAVDKELSDISKAFYQTTERTADTITRVDKIEISSEGINAKIEEVDKVSKEGDVALAQRITTLSAVVNDNSAKITQESTVRADADSALAQRVDKLEAEVGDGVKALIEEEARVRADADGALAERITNLKASSEAGDATLTQTMSVISEKTGKLEAKWGVEMDVNGKISGVSLNNDGKRSNFEVRADSFKFSDTSGKTSGGFESSGGVTKFSGELKAATGTFSGNLSAAKGSFAGDISAATGTFSGGLNITDQAGAVGMKITNGQILIYDESGRLRVKLGWLG